MARGNEITSVGRLTFRQYLHLLNKRVKNPPIDNEYDDFILKTWDFFRWRVVAEEHYRKHGNVAQSSRGALPLRWEHIDGPPGPPICEMTIIATRYCDILSDVLLNPRKVLNRVRSKVGIGRVQQMDSHCLRWLSRQPGVSPSQKAGPRQEILGVVREECFDTLENRVFKDLMNRLLSQTIIYLRKYASTYSGHDTIAKVKRLHSICLKAAECEEFDGVKQLRDFPQPNYVLQQERRYSIVWMEYCKIVREDDVAEQLWATRKEVATLYANVELHKASHLSPYAKYDMPLWINSIDGRKPILENPIWGNEEADSRPATDAIKHNDDIVIVDLSQPPGGLDRLHYLENHSNAKPILSGDGFETLEPHSTFLIGDIIRTRDKSRLADFFEQLYAAVGGVNWIVLTSDSWQNEWLEEIISARPARLPRTSFFLLWRSIAASLGYSKIVGMTDMERLAVVESLGNGICDVSIITFKFDKDMGRILPQRASTRLHSEGGSTADRRFFLGLDEKRLAVIKQAVRGGRLCRIGATTSGHDILMDGARLFIEESRAGLVSYYDELDPMWLVVQTKSEEVVFQELVRHNEYHPGGRTYQGDTIRPGCLMAGEKRLSLYVLEGDRSDTGELKCLTVDFDRHSNSEVDIFCKAVAAPGQGLATLQFDSAVLDSPLIMPLDRLQPSSMTKIRIEREMKRHFPPTMPWVEACEEIWADIRNEINDFMAGREIRNDLFAKAQNYWGEVGPACLRRYGVTRFFDDNSMSPIDKLKRENVFGNAPNNRFPVPNKNYDKLFFKLVIASKENPRYLRLLAWTYQYDNRILEPVRVELFKKYVDSGLSLDPVETSFCSNNFSDSDCRVGKMLLRVLSSISSGVQSENELRLAYNLMQFHPAAIKVCPTAICEKAFDKLVSAYNSYPFYTTRGRFFASWNRSTQTTKMAGYFIKCMLFMLHRRRFESSAISRPSEWSRDEHGSLIPPGLLNEPIPEYTPTLAGHEAMRKSLIEYVNGRGTLDGIPSN